MTLVLLQVEVLGSLLEGLSFVFSWPVIAFVIFGTILGLIFGAIPGLGAAPAIILLLPATYGMETNYAFAMFAAILGGTAFGGSISAILISTPGSGPNAATLLDGYPMAREGRAGEALGAAATASVLGALFGLLTLLVLLPFIYDFVLLFGSPEKFMLAVFGLVIVAVATRTSLVNGLIAGGLGLLLSFVGRDPMTGTHRFTLGSPYLSDGIPLIPALIGLFAIAEVIDLALKSKSVASGDIVVEGGIKKGVVAVITRPYLWLQSSVIGTIVGAVPGVGGTVATFIAYMRASQTNKNPEDFGKGDVRGVIASEAANDAKDGGAFMPTVALGIPGSAAWVAMLAALIFHGMSPGPAMLTNNLDVVFILIAALIVSNILTSLIGLLSAKQLARITKVPPRALVPIIIVLALIGAFSDRGYFSDVMIATAFGIFGYYMKVFDFSRIALIIGMILGGVAEIEFSKTIQITGYHAFFTEPIALGLLLITVASIIYPLARKHLRGGGGVIT